MQRHDLTKTKITLFEQCPKRLWLSVHRPDLVEIDDATRARFETGHAVGELACELVPGGVMVTMDEDVAGALVQTAALVASGDLPIFEGTFHHEGVLVRVDIMRPDRRGGWHVAEVKSTASRKAYQLADLATQVWVLEGAGIKVASASIRHINTSFVYAREGDYLGFLVDRISDEEIRPMVQTRPPVVQQARKTLHGREPAVQPGAQCNNPFECDFKSYCNRSVTQPAWPDSRLPRAGAKIAQRDRRDIRELIEVRPGELQNPLHKTMRLVAATGSSFQDRVKVREETGDWLSPRIYLGFETISPAIPRWLGTKPFQHVPFQFLVHIEQLDGKVEHREFVSPDGADPRRPFAEAIIEAMPPEGSISTYDLTFTRRRLKELASQLPDLSDRLRDMAERVTDLPPCRSIRTPCSNDL